MVTAELAVAIPAVTLVLVLAVSALSTVMDQVRCVDAASATARALARGDSAESALARGRGLAPKRAAFTTAVSSTTVRVTVRAAPVPGLAWLGATAEPHGEAVAALEGVEP
ncbi:TadE family type IV pilus minor pilin [Pedococcus sp. 5OH_020]|uniref:TadE family type IV pilus minor pilin n=1 Tax=Pedococcus sp. 5OH_020 TaxID=2989814 RepID=UPI0022EA0999|nr:TadE family type IV pilus minor pilin [Pedococcus sp. 5OH_020]